MLHGRNKRYPDTNTELTRSRNPHANKLTIHILAAVAQHEREMISARTSAAIKVAKARGRRLGNPKLSEARRRAAAARKERAERYTANVMPVIREIQTRRAQARALERGSIWRVILCLPTAPGLPLDRSAEFGTSALGSLSGKLLLADAGSYRNIGREAQ
jgi:DNA invertase Pin-like site-specific DNA recombinase